MIKDKLDKIFSKYFHNYDKENLEIGYLNGTIKLKNLDFNEEKINKSLEISDSPLRLKKGMLVDLVMDVSYINMRLQLLRIVDAVIVLEPHPDHMSTMDFEYTPKQLNTFMKHMFNNYERHLAGKPLQKLEDSLLTKK